MEEQRKEEAPTFGMRVKEESPSKIVLEWWDGQFVKHPISFRSMIPLLLVIAALSLIGVFSYLYYRSSSWLSWIISVGVIAIFYFIPRLKSSREEELGMNSLALAETISIDFDDQRATCVKNLQAGNIEQINLDLKDVSRVRIRAEEHGHHFRLYLESVSSESLQVGIAIGSYLPEALIAHGKKIGKILNKPVVLQHTNLGNLISEEVLQA